jgi:hypothetical protein
VSKVTVTGGTATGSATTPVTVNAAAPLAIQITSAPPGTIKIGQPVTFTGTISSSTQPPTSGVTWEWDFDGDGTPEIIVANRGSSDARTMIYGSAKAWTVKVKITDTATGRTASGTHTVTVVE